MAAKPPVVTVDEPVTGDPTPPVEPTPAPVVEPAPAPVEVSTSVDIKVPHLTTVITLTYDGTRAVTYPVNDGVATVNRADLPRFLKAVPGSTPVTKE